MFTQCEISLCANFHEKQKPHKVRASCIITLLYGFDFTAFFLSILVGKITNQKKITTRRTKSYLATNIMCMCLYKIELDEILIIEIIYLHNTTQVIRSRRQASEQIVQATHLSTPHPNNLSQFFALLRPCKATKQLLGVCRMASGVPLISKNAQDIILVLYKSKY